MCPKSFFKWKAKDMSFEEFKKISFSQFRYAHLQGWGEPLLNPEIGEMIDFAKKHCKLSLTTNGLLLLEWKEEILKLDLIAISIVGIDGQRAVRKTKLEELAEKIEEITSLKKRPKVVIATLMMKNTISELPKLVEEEALVCAENPIRNCFITVDCNLSPCAYLHLPTEEDFRKVWKSKSYSDFRKIYERRLFNPYVPLPECCKSCYKAYSL